MQANEWDERYGAVDAVWSREPNLALTTSCPPAPPGGRALDLGCGEGADARWLAGQGWDVTGVDWSRVAVERATGLSAGLAEPRPRFVVGDATDAAALSTLSPTGRFELVTAAYLHPEPTDRERTYAPLPDLLSPGGHLLVLTHHPDHPTHGHAGPAAHRMMAPADIVAALADRPGLVVVRLDVLERRDADGELLTVDSVVVVRRTGANDG